MKHTMNMPMIENSLWLLIIFIFLLSIITTNASSNGGYVDPPLEYTYTCSLYGGLYNNSCYNYASSGWYLTYTQGICPVSPSDQEKFFSLHDFFSNPLSYIYKFPDPYQYHALHYILSNPYSNIYSPLRSNVCIGTMWTCEPCAYSLLNVLGIGEKTETMRTCEPCMPDTFMMWSEPAAPPAY